MRDHSVWDELSNRHWERFVSKCLGYHCQHCYSSVPYSFIHVTLTHYNVIPSLSHKSVKQKPDIKETSCAQIVCDFFVEFVSRMRNREFPGLILIFEAFKPEYGLHIFLRNVLQSVAKIKAL